MSVNSDFPFPVTRQPKTIHTEREVDEISTTFSFDSILERLKLEYPGSIPSHAKIRGVASLVEVYWIEERENCEENS